MCKVNAITIRLFILDFYVIEILIPLFLKSGPTWTNTYLPSTSKVFDMNSPRYLSKACTHSELEGHGNWAYFNTELSVNKKWKEKAWLNNVVGKKVRGGLNNREVYVFNKEINDLMENNINITFWVQFYFLCQCNFSPAFFLYLQNNLRSLFVHFFVLFVCSSYS